MFKAMMQSFCRAEDALWAHSICTRAASAAITDIEGAVV
jgi:hypothetical protein